MENLGSNTKWENVYVNPDMAVAKSKKTSYYEKKWKKEKGKERDG